MDLLSDILGVMNLTGSLYFRSAFTAPWAIEVPNFEHVARFHYVHRGRCFVRLDGLSDPIPLEQGDLVIINRGAAHTLCDPAHEPATALDQVVERSGFKGRGALVFGGTDTGHQTQLICRHFAFDAHANHVLLDALPDAMHVRDYGKISPSWLDDTLKIIATEVGGEHLGADLIALRLSKVIWPKHCAFMYKTRALSIQA